MWFHLSARPYDIDDTPSACAPRLTQTHSVCCDRIPTPSTPPVGDTVRNPFRRERRIDRHEHPCGMIHTLCSLLCIARPLLLSHSFPCGTSRTLFEHVFPIAQTVCVNDRMTSETNLPPNDTQRSSSPPFRAQTVRRAYLCGTLRNADSQNA